MASNTYQPIITGEKDIKMAQKRRTIYLRPFILFWLASLFAETIFLPVGVFIMTGTRDLFYKVMWTLVFCPLGMGGSMGGLINCFIVDHYYGKKAAHFTGILALLVLSTCNYLCYSLDKHFGWFGASEHPLWFHWRYPMIWATGYWNGVLLFTDKGQERLARMGLQDAPNISDVTVVDIGAKGETRGSQAQRSRTRDLGHGQIVARHVNYPYYPFIQ